MWPSVEGHDSANPIGIALKVSGRGDGQGPGIGRGWEEEVGDSSGARNYCCKEEGSYKIMGLLSFTITSSAPMASGPQR